MEVVMHESQDLQALDLKGSFGDCLPSPGVQNDVTTNPSCSGGAEEKTEKKEIWIGNGDDHSLFYAADDFPPLPDFPCMSSSSSNSSTPAPAGGGFSSSSSSSSSTSAASWALLKSDASASDQYRRGFDQAVDLQQQSGTDGSDFDCMNVMDDFDCMGINQLIEDSNEIWDPTPLFDSTDQITPNSFGQIGEFPPEDDHQFLFLDPSDDRTVVDAVRDQDKTAPAEDLAVVFFEWLKSNKEAISAEELRSIKIKKSTIESAAKRLGGGKEGMKQLLKLILQWVQHHRLHNKPPPDSVDPIMINHPTTPPPQQPLWINPYVMDPPPPPPGPSFTSMVNYIGGNDHYHPYGGHQPYNNNHGLMPTDQYHMLDGTMSSNPWTGQLAPHPASFALPPPQPTPIHYNTGPDGSLLQGMTQQGFAGYANQYNPYQLFAGPGDGLVRSGSSATKEARKKRMARQRRVFTHHHRNQHNTNNLNQQHGNGNGIQHQIIQGVCVDPTSRVMIGDHDSTHSGWVYWPQMGGGGPMVAPPMHPYQQLQAHPPVVADRPGAGLAQSSQRQAATDRKQGFKTEKNMKFLLQKVLKQSDVGNLGRIVLPKKEAETHLPELEARDGIPIAMEDIGTSRVWNMRYRFWPNNKSRMYLLENTGDFVRSNGLQEGDFIVIYSDVKCGKYMIRGVKVRPQQQGSRPEVKKPSKALKTQNSASPASSVLSPLIQRQ